MRGFKHIQFSDKFEGTFAEFKKKFVSHLVILSENDKKKAYKEATKK